jgi:translation elongation factor EF-1beta
MFDDILVRGPVAKVVSTTSESEDIGFGLYQWYLVWVII